jgi:hypothetical protein
LPRYARNDTNSEHQPTAPKHEHQATSSLRGAAATWQSMDCRASLAMTSTLNTNPLRQSMSIKPLRHFEQRQRRGSPWIAALGSP